MKIEIEFEEVEHLRKKIEQQKRHIDELDTLVKSFDDKAIHEKAIEQSWRLFNNYMDCISKHIGFDWMTVNVENVRHWLGEHWWDNKKLSIEIGAVVSESYKRAFLNIGVKIESKEPEKDE